MSDDWMDRQQRREMRMTWDARMGIIWTRKKFKIKKFNKC